MAEEAETTEETQQVVPPWANDLADLVKQVAEQTTNLLPLAALDEAFAAAQMAGSGKRAPGDRDRHSLVDDLRHSFKSRGSRYSAIHRREIGRLLGDVCQRLAGGDLDDAPAARALAAEIDGFRGLLVQPDVMVAAWEDCIETIKKGETQETCELRVNQFRELAERGGHRWERSWALNGRLSGLLKDSVYEVDRARGIDDVIRTGSGSGVNLAERIQLSIAEIRDVPKSENVTVWLAACNAQLLRGYVQIGPVQFFEGKRWAQLSQGSTGSALGSWARPTELDDHQHEMHLDIEKLDGEEHRVLIRVRLENTYPRAATVRARQLVTDLLALASPDSEWRLMEGVSVHTVRGWSGSIGFEDPQQRDARLSRMRNLAREGTEVQLRSFDSKLVSVLAATDGPAYDALLELRYLEGARSVSDAAQRVLLMWRTLERVIPVPANETHVQAVGRWLRTAWVRDRILNFLWNVGYNGVYSIPDRNGDEAQREPFLRLSRALVRHDGPFIHVSYEKVPDYAAELAALFPTGTLMRAKVETVQRWVDDPAELRSRIIQLEKHFDRLVLRALRQRNNVPHGAPVVPAVVATVEPFVSNLANQSIHALLYAAAKGINGEQELVRRRDVAASELNRLCDGEPWANVIKSQ